MLREPAVADPPRRVTRDWVLVAAVVGIGAVELAFRPDLPWRPVGLLPLVVLAATLLWRRTNPLAAVAIGFGTVIVLDLVSIAGGAGGPVELYTMGFLLVLVYALGRWGSGRHVVIGLVIMLTAAGVGFLRDRSPLSDTIVGLVILMVPLVIGAALRFQTTARQRELESVRSAERTALARELHDTVAHHVSAMVVRAQAGVVVERLEPGAAVEALRVIEAEGARTLTEMRRLVGSLRTADAVALAPLAGIADIAALASPTGRPAVVVEVSGDDVAHVGPVVGAAAYRIAQESVTNAVRHARGVTRVRVVVQESAEDVRVRVSDDGEPLAGPAGEGYGLVGMAERATLLGGTFTAGPVPGGGWVVEAVLPLEVAG